MQKISPVEKVLESRRSIRKFMRDAIPKAQLDKVLKLALNAPTANNRQPVRIHVLSDPAKVQALGLECLNALPAELKKAIEKRITDLKVTDPVLCDAPCLVALTFAPEVAGATVQSKSPESWEGVEVGLATAYLEIAAEDAGLGSLTIGMTTIPQLAPVVAKHLKIPDSEKLLITVALGKKHPDFKPMAVLHNPNHIHYA